MGWWLELLHFAELAGWLKVTGELVNRTLQLIPSPNPSLQAPLPEQLVAWTHTANPLANFPLLTSVHKT